MKRELGGIQPGTGSTGSFTGRRFSGRRSPRGGSTADAISQELIRLLQDCDPEDPTTEERLLPRICRLAHALVLQSLNPLRPSPSIDPWEVVNEWFSRSKTPYRGLVRERGNYLRTLKLELRRLILEMIQRQERAGEPAQQQDSNDEADLVGGSDDLDLLALDNALNDLEKLDPEGAQIVMLRFFVGFTMQEVADVLGISRLTALRRWQRARVWLYQELSESIYGERTY